MAMNYDNRIKYLNFLEKAENQFKCEDFVYQDLHLWPLLKTVIFYIWRDTSSYENTPSSLLKEKSPGKLSGLKRFVKGWYNLKFKTYSRNEFLFLGSARFNTDYKGEYLNRYFDPIIDVIESESKNNSVFFEKDIIGGRKIYKERRIKKLMSSFTYCWNSYGGRRIRANIGRLQIGQVHPDISILINELSNHLNISSSTIETRILNNLKQIIVWERLFTSILKKVQPKDAFIINYASSMGYGFIHSCKKMNVRVTDFQHGAQGSLHWAYLGYKNYPRDGDGFNTLPDNFWVWDNSSFEFLKNQFKNERSIKPIYGGNPWINFLFENGDIFDIKLSKRFILITLQPIEPVIEDFVFESIQLLQDDYIFGFRFHPRMNKETRENIKNKIQNHNLENIDFEMSNSFPLQQLLYNCNLHISYYSGSIIEAGIIQRPSIILHKIGEDIFKREITEGKAFSFLKKRPEKLVQLISQIDSQHKRNENTSHISYRSTLSNEYGISFN